MSMAFLHNGIPMPRRKAVVVDVPPAADLLPAAQVSISSNSAKARLLAMLGHPNVASKHWIVRQYDHEVQGGSVVKPFVGPDQRGLVSGMLNLSRNLGLITGASVMGAVFALASGASEITAAEPDAVATGTRITFLVATTLILAALGIAFLGRPRQPIATEPRGPDEALVSPAAGPPRPEVVARDSKDRIRLTGQPIVEHSAPAHRAVLTTRGEGRPR